MSCSAITHRPGIRELPARLAVKRRPDMREIRSSTLMAVHIPGNEAPSIGKNGLAVDALVYLPEAELFCGGSGFFRSLENCTSCPCGGSTTNSSSEPVSY